MVTFKYSKGEDIVEVIKIDLKYIIGIIVAIIVIVGAYMVLAPSSQSAKITIAGSTSVQPVAENWSKHTWKNTQTLRQLCRAED